MLMGKLLTVSEAAQLLRLKPKTIRLWLETGRLRGFKVGRQWRIPVSELERLIPQEHFHGMIESLSQSKQVS